MPKPMTFGLLRTILMMLLIGQLGAPAFAHGQTQSVRESKGILDRGPAAERPRPREGNSSGVRSLRSI